MSRSSDQYGRRGFLKRIGLAIGAAGLWGTGAVGATEEPQGEHGGASGCELSRAVQMDFMRPGEIEAAGKKFVKGWIVITSGRSSRSCFIPGLPES